MTFRADNSVLRDYDDGENVQVINVINNNIKNNNNNNNNNNNIITNVDSNPRSYIRYNNDDHVKKF